MRHHVGCVGRLTGCALVLVLTLAACASGEGAGGRAEPESSSGEPVSREPTGAAEPAVVECGQPFRPPAAGGMTLTGRFPTSVSADEPAVVGTVEVAGRQPVRGVALPRADVFLVRQGRVVTLPMAQDAVGVRWDLAPGEVRSLPGEAPLVGCEPGGGAVPTGTYELYARTTVTTDDGAVVESYGGPWPIEVR
ncbi:hypothetical protein [Micromonospora rosaria]|uniref:hypothetical protein n=1 Tax=Micromonospora rosaria TaxID=47874 RepID=UPI000AFB4F9E|nr:hypothetical protein [Micromonospora rosaria]